MSTSSNFQEFVGTCSDFQRQLWNSWMGTVGGNPEPSWEQPYKRSLEISQEMVNCALKAQSDMTWICLQSLNSGVGTPKVVGQPAEQMEAMTERWFDAQRQASETWFKAVKDLVPLRGAGELTDSAQNIFQAWQDTAQKTLEIPAVWMSSLVPGPEVAKPERKAPPRKRTKSAESA